MKTRGVLVAAIAVAQMLGCTAQGHTSTQSECADIDGWGSSLIVGLAPALAQITALNGLTYSDKGRKGELLFQTANRLRESVAVPDGCVARFAIVNLGKNDLSRGRDEAAVMAETEQAIQIIAKHYRDYIVVGHFLNTNTPPRSSMRARVRKLNAELRLHYGSHYVDVEQVILDRNVWNYAGIAPTKADIAQQLARNKPQSLSIDSGHLNIYGNYVLAKYIGEAMARRGWKSK